MRKLKSRKTLSFVLRIFVLRMFVLQIWPQTDQCGRKRLHEFILLFCFIIFVIISLIVIDNYSGGPFFAPLFLQGPFFARFLLLRNSKKSDTHGFQKENSQKSRIICFLIWVIFLQNIEIFAYFCSCYVSNYVFNKKNQTYRALYLKSRSYTWYPWMSHSEWLFFALKAQFLCMNPFFARFSSFLGV